MVEGVKILDMEDKVQSQDYEKDILNIFKAIKAYPDSGFGSVVVKLKEHRIVHCEKTESIKLQEPT